MTDIQARPTMYRGVELRSRLEGAAARWLDRYVSEETGSDAWADGILRYEERAYSNRQYDYLPDFTIRWPDGRLTFYEVKPDSFSSDEIEAVLGRMHCIRDTHPEADLLVMKGQWIREAGYDWVLRICTLDDFHLTCRRCLSDEQRQQMLAEWRGL